jgi:glycosyltransferase involved in cell wall biosynthesis
MVLDLATALADDGHMVEVVCPYPSRPAGVQHSADEISAVAASVASKGIVLTRVNSFTTTKSRIGPRMRESWSFGRSAAAVVAKSTGYNVLYDAVWPMFAQAWVGFAAKKPGIPQVSHIMDVYPESAYPKVPWWIQACVRRPLVALDRANALHARKLVVISESMRKVYLETRGIPFDRMEVLHTWQDEALFQELPKRESAVRRYNLPPDLFTFLYLGNIGPVAGVDHLIHSFAGANLSDSQLLIVGEGTQKPACIQSASRTGANVRFISDPAVANVPLLHSLADVCLLPMKLGAASSSFPSKLTGYMLSGKPVLASVGQNSDSANLVRKADCGWVVESEDIEALAGKMRELRSLGYRELAAAGARGRSHAMEHLSKRNGVRRLVSIILDSARK